MFPKIVVHPRNIAWLGENCIASYFNYFVIGKINSKGGFGKNSYIKFRFVDFVQFVEILQQVNIFFLIEPTLSKENICIIVTSSYKISWQGCFDDSAVKKTVKFIADFKNEASDFSVTFDYNEYTLLIKGFLNIAVDVFCYCPQVRCVFKCFLEKIVNTENEFPEDFFDNQNNNHYYKLCFEICRGFEITKFKSYSILNKLLHHRQDLLRLIKLNTFLNEHVLLQANCLE